MVANHPQRFGAFAILPLPDVGAAVREAEYVLDTLKLESICLLTHVSNRQLGQPEEDELYAEFDRRNAVVFIHPLRNQAKNMPAYNYPAGMTELVLDTRRAVHNLLWNGTFGEISQHPLDHATWWRNGSAPGLSDERHEQSSACCKKSGRWHGRQILEICVPAPLKCLMEITEPSHILFRSDFPFSRHRTPVKDGEWTIAAFEAFGDWDASVRRAIESDTALKLFPRFAKSLSRTE